jgi:(p)ppGpp synthase/HD superfamily hydrolase
VTTPPFVPSLLAGRPLPRSAYLYARERHRGQRRESDHAPFIAHPLEVAALLETRGRPEAIVVAGILHDTIENTEATAEEIATRFGDEVARIVSAVSDDPAIADYAERKAALRDAVAAAGADVRLVYAADKVAKVRELRARLGRGENERDAFAAKLEHYRASLEMLEAHERDEELVRLLRFELELLEAAPPEGGRG